MTTENPYRTLHARMSPPGAAWDEGFAAGRAAEREATEHARLALAAMTRARDLCKQQTAQVAATLVREREVWSSTDRDHADSLCHAARLDERERLSARVYENGWCPTCARSVPSDPQPMANRQRTAAAGGVARVIAAPTCDYCGSTTRPTLGICHDCDHPFREPGTE